MNILGLNAYHGDSAACVVQEGVLVAAAEEERFRRVKHWAGLPTEAIRYCLREAGVAFADIDLIAVNRKPSAHLIQKAIFALKRRPDPRYIRDRIANAGCVRGLGAALAGEFGADPSATAKIVRRVEHHRAHLASAFMVSPFSRAALVSVDGFGDFVSTMCGVGSAGNIEVSDEILFPHSLGLFYLAITQHLGFPRYGDEYKVMGLAPYGTPSEMGKLRRVVRLRAEGRFSLGLEYFRHHTDGVAMNWEGGEPTVGAVGSAALADLLGPARCADGPLEQRHADLAASVQQAYEEAFFHLLDHVHAATGETRLCLAGGCAMNSVANGKIFDRTGFRDLYVQSAAGDAGGAVGAAYYLWSHDLGHKRPSAMVNAYLGPSYTGDEIAGVLAARKADLAEQGCCQGVVVDEPELCRSVAEAIASGKVVGWFQGRMEWGPRALGNRSILGDPRRADMKEILNVKIKRRESFRPFAPSILREAVPAWFETDYDVPFMLQVFQIREEKRALIPAVTHVNGSGRLQTVTQAQNPRFFRLISAFADLTGVPMLLNTSFNENEPVVCRPEEALDCFLRTKMDLLVLGNTVVERRDAGRM